MTAEPTLEELRLLYAEERARADQLAALVKEPEHTPACVLPLRRDTCMSCECAIEVQALRMVLAAIALARKEHPFAPRSEMTRLAARAGAWRPCLCNGPACPYCKDYVAAHPEATPRTFSVMECMAAPGPGPCTCQGADVCAYCRLLGK